MDGRGRFGGGEGLDGRGALPFTPGAIVVIICMDGRVDDNDDDDDDDNDDDDDDDDLGGRGGRGGRDDIKSPVLAGTLVLEGQDLGCGAGMLEADAKDVFSAPIIIR